MSNLQFELKKIYIIILYKIVYLLKNDFVNFKLNEFRLKVTIFQFDFTGSLTRWLNSGALSPRFFITGTNCTMSKHHNENDKVHIIKPFSTMHKADKPQPKVSKKQGL